MKKRWYSIFLVLCLMATIMAPMKSFGAKQLVNQSDTVRYTVLVLDCSGSMSGNPFDQLKIAAKKFVGDMIGSQGENHVAVVAYGSGARVAQPFTVDRTKLETAINGMTIVGGTNIHGALHEAQTLLSAAEIPEMAVRNVVLMLDGLPIEGRPSLTGTTRLEQIIDIVTQCLSWLLL